MKNPSLSEGAWQVTGAAADFDAWARVLKRFVSALLAEDLELAEGVGEAQYPCGQLAYAVARSRRFMALRLHARDKVYELFCLQMAEASPLLLGHRALSSASGAAPWWVAEAVPSLLDGTPGPPRIPSFLELALLLAGQPGVCTRAEVNERLEDALLEARHFRELSADQAEEIRRLNERVSALQSAQATRLLAGKTVPALHAADPPDWTQERDLSGLERWADGVQGRLKLVPRAFAGAKKSRYNVPGHVYRALTFLAGPYCDYRRGQLTKEGMEAEMAAAGCQLEGSVGASVAGEHGDTYFVRWEGRRRLLDLHLRRGGGRDERFCLRVYFFWDDASSQVVVGWLPSHLNNSLT